MATATQTAGAPPADPILAQVRSAANKRRLTFRIQFILTWIILIGGLIAAA